MPVLRATNKIDVTVNTKRSRHFSQCTFEVYIFIFQKRIYSAQFSAIHTELRGQKQSINPIAKVLI